jgi:hypothetical protein
MCLFFLEPRTHEKGGVGTMVGSKVPLLANTHNPPKKGRGELKLPLFFFFFYVCLFQEEAHVGFAIIVFFTKKAIVAMIGIKAFLFIYIHNQREKNVA